MIILVAILVPMLLFGKLDNVYIQLLLVSTVWLGLIGGLDDYIKVFRHRKEGLKGRFKIVGQVGLGVIVGTTMWLSPDIVVREKVTQPVQTVYLNEDGTVLETVQRHVVVSSESLKTTQTTIPFVKNNEFDYGWLTGGNSVATWILYVLVAIFVVTAVSNGANLTDGSFGPDRRRAGGAGLSFGPHRLCRLPQYHVHPGQRRDGGLRRGAGGGAGGFPVVQLLPGPDLHGRHGFKYTKRRYGEGRRILLMSPVHHHYQKKGIFETKIVLRFWIISLLLAAITLVTLKIR